MRALCCNGINDLRVEDVPDPTIVNPRDAIVRVILTTRAGATCTSSTATSRRCKP